MPRPKDTKTKIVVQIQPFNKKSLNYSIRLKEGVSITEGLNEIIKQIEKR
jgi:hypothetical protein